MFDLSDNQIARLIRSVYENNSDDLSSEDSDHK